MWGTVPASAQLFTMSLEEAMNKLLTNLFRFSIAVIVAAILPTMGHAENAPPYLRSLGPNIPGDTEFVFPDGLAIDSHGNIYVIDLADIVRKFRSDGTFVLRWGSGGAGIGQFRGAPGIAVDGNDFVYVADMGNHRIQKFTGNGTFVSTWGTRGGGDGQFNYPFDIAVGPDGYLYVTDQVNCRVQVFTSNGTFVRKWGSLGYGNGQFYQPYGISIDQTNGNVYIVENNATNTVRVQKFTSEGIFLTKWGSGGTANGQFNHPMKVAVNPNGNVYVTDKDNDRVQAFTGDGTFVLTWGNHGSGNSQFNMPFGIAFDNNGKVIVTDHYNHRLQWFSESPTTVNSTSWGRLKMLYR